MGQHNGASSPSSCTCLQQLLSAAQKPGVLRTALYNGALILTWYTLSTLLSLYNKQLLGRDGKGIYGKGAFPAPLLMSALQFALQHLLARLVFLTGLVSRTNKPDMGWMAYLRNVVPNGITTGLDIGFSNMSLVFITMSFYTMCKSTVPVYLLLFAFLWRIEKPSWELAAVVAIICSGLVLLVEGESSFNAIGFALVMTASCLAGLRFTLTQVLLHGHQDAVALGGPLEVLELLTPIMAATVLLLSLACEHLFTVLPASPYFSSYSHTALSLAIVLVGATLAFLMVWTEFCVIKETSALTFMIAGTCKEVVTVIVAVLVFGDRFGPVNGVGLAIVILGVLLYNWQKLQRSFQQSDETLLRRRGSQEEESLELEPLIIAKSSVSSPPASLLVPGVTSAATPPSPHLTELGLRGAMADLGSAAAARIVAPPATTANGHDRLGPHASISRERIGSS